MVNHLPHRGPLLSDHCSLLSCLYLFQNLKYSYKVKTTSNNQTMIESPSYMYLVVPSLVSQVAICRCLVKDKTLLFSNQEVKWKEAMWGVKAKISTSSFASKQPSCQATRQIFPEEDHPNLSTGQQVCGKYRRGRLSFSWLFSILDVKHTGMHTIIGNILLKLSYLVLNTSFPDLLLDIFSEKYGLIWGIWVFYSKKLGVL